jgi:hypothetical protein
MLLMVAVFMLTRLGGIHLHLCLDGSEPRVAIHMEDGELHHLEPGANTTHHDVDVAAAGEVLNKFGLVLLGALFACLFFLPLASAKRTLAGFFKSQAISTSPHFLRPPLRGPPARVAL